MKCGLRGERQERNAEAAEELRAENAELCGILGAFG
jgi:hypothetical protein